ncbi:MAG: DUF4093 domain-containing protein [Bacilli bacterium]|nr:DUF4093 domain-containing protein [Bacilli bacterium]
MKYYCDGVIVVEGTNDSSYLSSFIEALYIETNGYDIKDDDLDFLINCNKKIIILTDSDIAGETIRNRLIEKLPKSLNVRVNSNLCNKHGKHGVAECEKQEILNVLEEHLSSSKKTTNTVQLKDLISLGFEQKEIKNAISKLFHLGTTKNKEMLKRINFIGITKQELEKEVKNLYGNK